MSPLFAKTAGFFFAKKNDSAHLSVPESFMGNHISLRLKCTRPSHRFLRLAQKAV